MRDVLDLCVELDTMAAEAYRALSSACEDPDLARLFGQMAREEEAHVGWWSELLRSWEHGLIPDIVTDPEAILGDLHQIRADVADALAGDVAALSPAGMLELAARLEYFMLDPLFAELIDLTEPARTGHHRDAYQRHIERLVGAIEGYAGADGLSRFLARVLRRALRDNVALATYATRDPLTGLYNRRGMLGHLTQWISWAYRYERPVMVLLIDLDEFKAVNDTHGHAIGDLALKAVASVLEGATRESDLVARYGGDEFAVVAPETHAEEYPALVERILVAVGDAFCPDDDGGCVKLSVSVGGAALAPGIEVTHKVVDLVLAAADASMYEAKAAGRNRAGTPVLVDSALVERT